MLRSAATECWVGLVFSSPDGARYGHQRDVQEEAVVAADVVAHLAGRLEERQRLDVADRAADLGDHDVRRVAVGVGRGHRPDAGLDLVGDVRDDLDGVAEVLAAALLGDHRRVDLAGGDVGRPDQVGVEEALVVPDVEVGLGAVLGDEHLAVLERVHRPGVDVEVRVQLLHRHAQPARLEQGAEAGGREALAERGGDAPGDEQMLGGLWLTGGVRSTEVHLNISAARPRGAAATAPRRAARSACSVSRSVSRPLACIWRSNRARANEVGANGAAAATTTSRGCCGVARSPDGSPRAPARSTAASRSPDERRQVGKARLQRPGDRRKRACTVVRPTCSSSGTAPGALGACRSGRPAS